MLQGGSDRSALVVPALLLLVGCLAGAVDGIKFEVGPCFLQFLEPCTEDVIQFYLFSSARPRSGPTVLSVQRPQVPDWIDLASGSTKLIVHGYGGNLDFYATKAIRDAYLVQNHTNVIIADWGKLAQLPCYPTAVLNTRQAGECLARFMLRLQPLFGGVKKFEAVHLIGFSLGAHVVSFASNIVREEAGVFFDRITGLDPALPFFTTLSHRSKLDRSDAKFVDVLHTNSGIFGKIEASGHVDFYLNGGQRQPACDGDLNVPLCSHMLSTIYFAESINSAIGFWGARCSSYFQYIFGWCRLRSLFRSNQYQMGEHCPSTARGIVFVETNSNPPYALGL